MYFWNVKRFTLPQMPSEKHSNVIRYSAHGEKSGRWPAAANTRSVLAHTNCFDYRHLLSTKFRSYQLDTRTEPVPRTTRAENGCRGFFFSLFFFYNCWYNSSNCRNEPKCKIKSSKTHKCLFRGRHWIFTSLIQERRRVFVYNTVGWTWCCPGNFCISGDNLAFVRVIIKDMRNNL